MMLNNVPEEFHGILRLDVLYNRKSSKTKQDGFNTIKPTEVVDLSNKSDYEKKIILENLKYNR